MSTSPGTGTGTPASSIRRKTNAASSPWRSRNDDVARPTSVHQSTMPDARSPQTLAFPSFVSPNRTVLALDIGGTKIAAAIVDTDAQLLASDRINTARTHDADVLFADLQALCAR